MARKHTPEELAEAQRILAERKPHMDKMVAQIQQERVQASKTIEMLQRRVRSKTIELELEGGDKIEIYSRLSEATTKELEAIEDDRLDCLREAGRLIDLLKTGHFEDPAEIKRAQTEIKGQFDRAGDCWLKVIATITVDPAITYEWLKENPDKYSSEDIADAYLTYKELRKQQIAERHDRVMEIISFRRNKAGEGIHAVPSVVGDPQPGGVREPTS